MSADEWCRKPNYFGMMSLNFQKYFRFSWLFVVLHQSDVTRIWDWHQEWRWSHWHCSHTNDVDWCEMSNTSQNYFYCYHFIIIDHCMGPAWTHILCKSEIKFKSHLSVLVQSAKLSLITQTFIKKNSNVRWHWEWKICMGMKKLFQSFHNFPSCILCISLLFNDWLNESMD